MFFMTLVVLSALFFSFFNPIFVRLSGSFSSLFENVPIVEYFRSKGSLIDENNSLKVKINDLTAENADRISLYNENVSLNEHISRSLPANSILSKVLQKPGFSPYDVFTLDAGSSKGVQVGDNVFFGNVALGVISEVSADISRAKLFSSAGNKSNVILGNTKNEVEAIGQGGGGFEIILPKGVEVKEGDPVVFPDISLKAFGFVKVVLNDPSDVFQKVFFNLPVNLNEIDFVSIEK